MHFTVKALNPCFPEVTSLANGPVMTPDSRADVAGFVAELTLCLLHLYHKLAHCTIGTMLTCQFHLSGLNITKHCEQRREHDAEQKLKLTALKKSTHFHYGAFLCEYEASSFSICRMLLCVCPRALR